VRILFSWNQGAINVNRNTFGGVDRVESRFAGNPAGKGQPQ
jgi:hypothetical protein